MELDWIEAPARQARRATSSDRDGDRLAPPALADTTPVEHPGAALATESNLLLTPRIADLRVKVDERAGRGDRGDAGRVLAKARAVCRWCSSGGR